MNELPVPKFRMGEKVFYGNIGWLQNQVRCPDCLGHCTWSVTTPAGETFDVPCSVCQSGWQSIGTITKWNWDKLIRCVTIGAIRIESDRTERPVHYMCNETGIGSGQTYDEKDLFSSQREAEEHAQQLLNRQLAYVEDKEAAERKKKERKFKPSAEAIKIQSLEKRLRQYEEKYGAGLP